MSAPHDPLRAALHDLADAVEPADLHDRALRRSHRTGRREAAAGTGAALVALGLLGSGLRHLPSPAPPAAADSVRSAPVDEPPPPVVAVPSADGRLPTPATVATSPTTTAGPPAPRSHRFRFPVPEVPAVPRSAVLTDLPGHVFYQQTDPRPDVIRLSPRDGTTVTVLADAPSPVGISPDGERIAYVDAGTLLVGATGDDAAAEPVAEGVATADQAPAWSPDGARLLIDADTPAVLEVASGAITPLPAGFRAGQHFRWSGDGRRLVYATAHCGLEVAARTAGTGTSVPVLGDQSPADNPDGLAACRPTSVDATGQRATVPLQATGTADSGAAIADTVVDTVTGALLTLPVAGRVTGAVFDAAGNLLVRTVRAGRTTLSLFGPGNVLLVQANEPPAVRDLDLLAYTR